MTAPMAPIHPQYIPYEVLRPWGYSDGSTAAVIYQTSRCNGKFVHHRTSPDCRGLRAVDNVTSIETGGYRRKLWYRTESPQRRVSIGDHPHLLLAGFLDRAPQRRLSGTSVG